MKTTIAVGGAIPSQLVNALNNPVYSHNPQNDGEIPYPDLDKMGAVARINQEVGAEASRARGVESSLSDAVGDLGTAICSEAERAQNAEADLADAIGAVLPAKSTVPTMRSLNENGSWSDPLDNAGRTFSIPQPQALNLGPSGESVVLDDVDSWAFVTPMVTMFGLRCSLTVPAAWHDYWASNILNAREARIMVSPSPSTCKFPTPEGAGYVHRGRVIENRTNYGTSMWREIICAELVVPASSSEFPYIRFAGRGGPLSWNAIVGCAPGDGDISNFVNSAQDFQFEFMMHSIIS